MLLDSQGQQTQSPPSVICRFSFSQARRRGCRHRPLLREFLVPDAKAVEHIRVSQAFWSFGKGKECSEDQSNEESEGLYIVLTAYVVE